MYATQIRSLINYVLTHLKCWFQLSVISFSIRKKERGIVQGSGHLQRSGSGSEGKIHQTTTHPTTKS